jgi:hypothetical protein
MFWPLKVYHQGGCTQKNIDTANHVPETRVKSQNTALPIKIVLKL